MKFLITGGAGFIGACSAKALWERGHEVVLYDDLNGALYPASLKQARLHHLFPDERRRPPLIVGSILDDQRLQSVFAEGQFDVVLHFAALANPGRSLHAPLQYMQTNVIGTFSVLNAACQHNVKRLIFAGSSSVYNDEQTPFREDHYPLRPKSPYGATKAAGEVLCRTWHELHGMPITVLRFFSVYGPWGRPDMAPVIFARQILRGETLVVSEGRSRDLTYIDDAVSGVMAAIDNPFEFEIFNIGRGQPQPLSDLIAALGKAAGREPKTRPQQPPPGELATTSADISRARERLGYAPKIFFEEGAGRLIGWTRNYYGLAD